MLTRRQFLLRSTATTAGFFVPEFVVKANQYFKTHSKPFLEEINSGDIIFATRDSLGFELHIGEPYELPFDLTVEGVLDYGEVEPEWFYDQVADCFELESGVDPQPYFQDWFEAHCQDEFDTEFVSRNNFSSGRAYNELVDLDLGGDFKNGKGTSLGHIDFIDGCCPGNDYLGVSVKDDLSLSLLQNRLIQLNSRYQVQIY